MRCLVGIDDTDSSRGACTTHLAFRVASDLQGVLKVVPYPRLVRLNPNIPFKTRGNAAVCLQIETDDPDLAFDALVTKMKELSDVGGGANSGLVFHRGAAPGREFADLYHRALSGVVNPASVRRLLKEKGVRSAILGNGMGIVGAAASLGFSEAFDHTYELISYREQARWGTPRRLDPKSVEAMDRATYPHTFNSFDYQKRRPLVAPHGPDPVLAGVRGDSPPVVLRAFRMLRFGEPILGHMVYASNQHTDAHLSRSLDWKAYSAGWATGDVASVETGSGGHVYVGMKIGRRIRRCAFYEPTGDLRRAARRLAPGDRIVVAGGVRRASSLHPAVLNVERMEVLALARPAVKGALEKGVYIASPRSNRHLTKPLCRYGVKVPSRPAPDVKDWLSPAARPRRPRVHSARAV